MKKNIKYLVIVLIVLNLMILLGQIWPAGAPPFARVINILFLTGNLIFMGYLLRSKFN